MGIQSTVYVAHRVIQKCQLSRAPFLVLLYYLKVVNRSRFLMDPNGYFTGLVFFSDECFVILNYLIIIIPAYYCLTALQRSLLI